jgi:hypothetical protein
MNFERWDDAKGTGVSLFFEAPRAALIRRPDSIESSRHKHDAKELRTDQSGEGEPTKQIIHRSVLCGLRDLRHAR